MPVALLVQVIGYPAGNDRAEYQEKKLNKWEKEKNKPDAISWKSKTGEEKKKSLQLVEKTSTRRQEIIFWRL